MSKKDGDAAGRIKTYLEQQNRPYSVNDIFLNLHKDIGKTAVQKALDQLVADGCIREKAYGKQKVYVYNQDLFPPLDEETLRKMDAQITDLTTSLESVEKENAEVEGKLRTLNSSLTTEEANKKMAELEAEVTKLTEKLAALQDNQVLVSREDREAVTKESSQMSGHWRKRRRMALDILDAILEGYPNPKKQLMEEIGVETDEDVGVTFPKV